jgi:hypothetical protein
MNMEDRYDSANRQDRLMAKIAGITKIPTVKKVIGNSFFIALFD